MGKQNRSHPKIASLPEALRKEVENRLLEGYTYQQISDYLAEMGHSVHYASVQRYGRPFLQKFEAVRLSKEFAKLLAEDNVDRPTTELHEANNALMCQIIMDILINETMEPEEKIKAAKSVAELQKAQVNNERLKIASRKAAGEVRSTMNVLKTKLFGRIVSDYPELAGKLMEIADEVEQEETQYNPL